MKKIINISLAAIALLATACSKDEPGGVAIQDACGTWCCTVQSNDYWFTTQYYLNEGQTNAEINDSEGDPYGYYNPDVNGDGKVDMADLESAAYANTWVDEYGTGVKDFITSNTAANTSTEMLLTDPFWGSKVKLAYNPGGMTFSCGNLVSANTTIVTSPTTTAKLTQTYDAGFNTGDDTGAVVLGGKILKNAATAPGSGMKRDSIVFYVKYTDDLGAELYYKVSGYRKTGYTEDNL